MGYMMQADNLRRISVCQFSTFRWSFEEDIARYSALGIGSVGIWRRKLDDIGHSNGLDLVYNTKMSVSSLHWAGGFTGDGQTFADSIEDAIESILLASQLNANCLILHPGSRNGHTIKHAHRLLESALTTLIPIAADYGVKLVLEPMFGKQSAKWTFINNYNRWLELFDKFPAEHLGCVLDTYHSGFDSRVFEGLDQLVERVALVQLADRNFSNHETDQPEPPRLPLGQGQVPLEAWLGKLQHLGYDGPLELEIHGPVASKIDYHSMLDSTIDFLSSNKMKNLLTTMPQSQQRGSFTNRR